MNRLSRLRLDVGGAALAELALVLPFMLALLFGSSDVLQLVETQRRMSRVASAIGDLTTQASTLSDGEVADILKVGPILMDPLPATDLGQRLVSFSADEKGKVSVDWQVSGPIAYAGTAPVGLPPGYTLRPNQSVVVADVSYRYRPVTKYLLVADIPLQRRMLLRPRASDVVGRTK